MKINTKITFLVLLFSITGTLLGFGLLGQERINNSAQLQMQYEMNNEVSGEIAPFQRIAKSIIGGALMLSLIVVIYHVANDAKYGKGKQAVISWVIAVTIYVIAIALF